MTASVGDYLNRWPPLLDDSYQDSDAGSRRPRLFASAAQEN